ncbi:MAG TPA: histidine kinase [Acidobacteria bacterium]|nr:histidine kinase [Acidobacteriota bacterium]HIE91761.1 histidine kinase [Acidobacteriota bacterium]
MRDELNRLVDEMVAKGIRYDDARQEFERRFISRALARSEGKVGRAAKMIGLHRNTLSRKVTEYRLKRTG